MLNKILIFALFLFALNHKNKVCEGTMNSNNRELCSNHPGLKSFMFNENCDDNHQYKVIENCLGSGDSLKDCKLCKNSTYGQCKPTLKGGYCAKDGIKTDADGNKLKDSKIGRDISNFTEEELEDFDSRGYDEMKNECNPFRTRRDRDEEDDFYDDEDQDEGKRDRIDRRSHRRHRSHRSRRRHERHRRSRGNTSAHEELNEYKTIYYIIGISLTLLVLLIGYLYKKGKIQLPKFLNKEKVVSTGSD
jgi:hypothetical protein